MAGADKIDLISNEEEYPQTKEKEEKYSDINPNINHTDKDSSSTESGTNTDSSSVTEETTNPNKLAGIFVTSFHTKLGNTLDWYKLAPGYETTNLIDGSIEFKALPSGGHNVQSDFVYFRHERLYGLACFRNLRVDTETERGLRTRSVGVLAPNYNVLYRYLDFLDGQVGRQLANPGNFDHLSCFFDYNMLDKPTDVEITDSAIISVATDTGKYNSYEDEVENIHCPSGIYKQFIEFFREQTFLLWKLSLLNQRILFVAPPPIGAVCHRVYCCANLGKHSVPNLPPRKGRLHPWFYINVADIDTIRNQRSYVACTTERVFDGKVELYDAIVDGQTITVVDKTREQIVKVNKADITRWKGLQIELEANSASKHPIAEDTVICRYLEDASNRLLGEFDSVRDSPDMELTAAAIQSAGLDPKADRVFVLALLQSYSIDAILVVDNPCCP